MASTQDSVLEAALELFSTKGYSATTIEDIKLRSDLSVGVIYHHFGSKEGIAGALYVQSLRDFQRGLVATLDRRAPDAAQTVKAAVGHHLHWMDENRRRARFLMRRRETEVVETNRDTVDDLNRLLFDSIELWYRPRAEAGEIRDLPLPLLFSIWFGPAQEYARAILDGPLHESAPTLTDAEPVLAETAWAALKP